MPVRIYEIAKELNLESKLVLARAKELGISAAKVPSSSLDKITAEYLKEQLLPLAGQVVPAPEGSGGFSTAAPPPPIPWTAICPRKGHTSSARCCSASPHSSWSRGGKSREETTR